MSPHPKVRVRALEKVELRRVVGLTVFGQVEAELPELGALVGEKAVERVVEHRRDQLPHHQNLDGLGSSGDTVLVVERACSVPQRSRGRGVCGLSPVLQTPLPPGSHRCPVKQPDSEGAHLGQRSGMSPDATGAKSVNP